MRPQTIATIETALSLLSFVMLSGFIWVTSVALPKARREQNRFGVACSMLAAFLALIAWLLIGTGARSG